MTLSRLEPYFGTQFFLVDLETGEMFAYIQQQWRRAGLYCSNKPFVIKDLIPKVELPWTGHVDRIGSRTTNPFGGY